MVPDPTDLAGGVAQVGGIRQVGSACEAGESLKEVAPVLPSPQRFPTQKSPRKSPQYCCTSSPILM